MKRNKPKNLDAMTMLAMAKARTKQERRAVYYLIAMALVMLGLGLIAWLFWPEEIPHVTFTAYDAIALPEETIALYARAEPENRERSAKVDGLDVRFQITATPKDETVATDAEGMAHIDWSAPKAADKPIEFMVRYQHQNDPKKVARDSARIYVWPAKTKLLVVDVEALREGAAKALRTLGARYKIVYLTTDRATSYRFTRSSLTQPQTTPDGQVPDGPLLRQRAEGESDSFAGKQIDAIKNSFTGEIVGIAGESQEAKAFLGARWKAFLIGDATDAPDAATVLADWAELVKKLQ
jgi:hypothetical protein